MVGFLQCHPTRTVLFGEVGVEVDEELADVISLLGRLGITTTGSCQDGGESLNASAADLPYLQTEIESRSGRAYIDFPDLENVRAAYGAISVGLQEDELVNRITYWRAPGAWLIRFHLIPGSSSHSVEGRERPLRFNPGIYQVEFPRNEIPLIGGRLAVALELLRRGRPHAS